MPEPSSEISAKCEKCRQSLIPLAYPHCERKCAECGKTAYVCEPGEGGEGIFIRAGDRFVIPAGHIQISLDPAASRGVLTRTGITWFVQLLHFQGDTASPDQFETTLANYAAEADLVLKSSEPLKHLNLEDTDQCNEAMAILEKQQGSSEWWAAMVATIIEQVKKALSANDAPSAAWWTNKLGCFRSMLIFQRHLERTVWQGYTAGRLQEVLRVWKENEGNDNEEFWQQTIAGHALILSQLFSFPVVVMKEKAYVGGKGIDNTGAKLLDFLVQNQLTTNTALVEIKTPLTRLLAGEYRSNVFPPSLELSGAITQILTYKDTFTKDYHTLRGRSEETFNTFDPPCLVIAGNFRREIHDRGRQASFELFRNSLRGVQVVTYDEVFDKIGHLLSLLRV